MPSSYSSSLRFNLQFTGENINLWGELLNTGVFTLADYAIAGWLNKALTATPYALTSYNGSTDEARAAMIKFTGATGPWTVTIPSVSKQYLIWNATSGIVTITTGAGASVSIDSGDIVFVACDGTNVKTPGFGGYSIKEYIAATAFASSGPELPAQLGNAGKFVRTDGTNATWQNIQASDVVDFEDEAAAIALVLGRR